MSKKSDKTPEEIEKEMVKDSLHLMDMDILPLETPALKRARLVKNNQIETQVEMFRDSDAGSGQVSIDELPGFFPDSEDEFKRDLELVKQFNLSPSFDVYTIRIVLRSLNIEVENQETLKLSPTKRAELTDRMKDFTHPLIQHIYGADQKDVNDVSDILALFTDPDPKGALEKLKLMATKLDVGLAEIPIFLEDYGDIFLSLAYFRDILDRTVPITHEFLEWLTELRESYVVKQDRAQEKLLRGVGEDVADITGSITGRFESFDRKTQDFWTDISAERFHEVRDLITSHHTTIGGVLCGLTLKMDAWKEKFKAANVGGPQQRLEFTRSEILPGLGYIKQLEQRAAKG